MRKNKYQESFLSDSNMETEDYEIDPDKLSNSMPHRSLGDEEDDEIDLGITLREAQPYIHSTRKMTQFFSTSDPSVLFRNLASYVDVNSSQFKFYKSHFGCQFKVNREKEGEVDISVNILKVKDQDKHWVKFIKNSGDIFAFSDIFEKIRKFFGGHVNAKYEDE